MGFRMYVPTRIIFGAGSLNKLSRQKLPGKKALVVISNGKSTRANGYLDRTLEALQQAGAETVVFDQVMANPLKSTVMAGGAFAREQGYETDFTGHRRHHEIYLSNPRRTAPEKLKTVLRHPVRAK